MSKAKPSMLELMLQLLSSLYALDKTHPSITLAYLPDSNEFYGSICRYADHASPSHPPDRTVVMKARGATVAEVVQQLTLAWQLNMESVKAMQFFSQLKSTRRKSGAKNNSKESRRKSTARRKGLRSTKGKTGRGRKETQR